MSKEYKEVETFTDFTGRLVQVGDEVVFPSRVSSSMWLNKGRVLKIEVHDWIGKTWRWVNGERVAEDTPRQDWRITVKVPSNSRVSRLEAIERIVKVRSAKEIELAKREAELRAMPARLVFGDSGTVPTDVPKPKGYVNLITFGEAAYE